MLRLAKIGAPEQELVRSFNFACTQANPVLIDVTLAYIPPATLNDEQEKERTRILGARRFNQLEDMAEQTRELEEIYNRVLASRVRKITGMTMRKLAAMIPMQPTRAHIEEAGGWDKPFDFDPADPTPLTDEERKESGYDEQVTTKGQAAQVNILYLINAHARLRDYIGQVIVDVGYFQDKDWESQLKN